MARTTSIIPVESTRANWSQRVTLGGINYRLTFKYQQRCSNFVVDLSLDDGTVLAAGVRVVCNWPLFARFTDSRLPAGQVMAISRTADKREPDIGELGENARVMLVYVDPTS